MTLRAILWCAVSTTQQATDERASLPQQEEAARAVCTQNAWQIVDILRVPGHSRRYVDIHECAAAMRSQGIDAFDKLLNHWQARDFDILIVRDGSRFARTQTLHSYVVEKTIDIGARIYSLADGFVDERNYRMWISMGGYASSSEIDNLVKRAKISFDAMAKRGIPANAMVAESHRIVRDPRSGKVIGVELDESRIQEWMDLATVVLEGTPYHLISLQMYERFGYQSPAGTVYNKMHHYRLLHTPSFWGHIARNFKYEKRGAWIWDENEAAPDGIILTRNAHQPVYTGELAEKVKAELNRRHEIRGKATPQQSYRFTGLFHCNECGNSLAYRIERRYSRPSRTLFCHSRNDKSIEGTCNNRRHLNEKKALIEVDHLLRQLQEYGWYAFSQSEDEMASREAKIKRLSEDIPKTEAHLRRLVMKQTTADENTSYIYDEHIASEGKRLKSMRDELRQLQAEHQAKGESTGQQRALEELRGYTVEDVLAWDENKLNQFLRRLLAKRRFFVQDGEVVAIGVPMRKPKRW